MPYYLIYFTFTYLLSKGILRIHNMTSTHLLGFELLNIFLSEKTFNRKEKVSSFILPEILVKNAEINKVNPSKLIHYLLENALTDLFLSSPTSCLD